MRTLSTLCSLLFGALAALPLSAHAVEPLDAPDQVIVPEVKQPVLNTPRFPSSDIELGIVRGQYGIRYYGFSRTTGLRLAYHINEDFYFEAQVDQTDVSSKRLWRVSPTWNPNGPNDPVTNPKYSFQGVVPLKTVMLSTGYEGLIPGEIHLFNKYDFLTTGYVLGGVGRVNFNSRNETAFRLGSGFRVYLTNSIVFRTEAITDFYSIDRYSKKLNKIQRKGVFDGALSGGLSFIF
jgi:outer membrane beta-barrel protein